jgi:hypothetical protein
MAQFIDSDLAYMPPKLSHSHGPAVGRRPTMRSKSKKRKLARRKTKLGLLDLEHAKAAVLASLHSPESQRCYRHAIDECVGSYCSEPRLSFNKTVVTRYRIQLEDRRLAPGTTNVRLAAVHCTGLCGLLLLLPRQEMNELHSILCWRDRNMNKGRWAFLYNSRR